MNPHGIFFVAKRPSPSISDADSLTSALVFPAATTAAVAALVSAIGAGGGGAEDAAAAELAVR